MARASASCAAVAAGKFVALNIAVGAGSVLVSKPSAMFGTTVVAVLRG